MNDYKPDKAAVDAWLFDGGAEIVLEVIRRTGWKVDVLTGDDWVWLPDIIVAADRVHNTIEINGAASLYHQAMLAAAVIEDMKPANFNEERRDWDYPMLREHEKFYECYISLCYRFLDNIMQSSKAAVSLIGKAVRA